MFEQLTAQSATENASLATLVYVMLMSFVLSTTLAFVYQKTFRGLSYSRNFVQSVILISLIAAMVIQSVGDSLARGIGIMAAMAIIRFRTNFKDPRDTLFLFAGLATGISCGAYAFGVALVGTLGFSTAALLLHYSPLGPNAYFDGMLRFNMLAEGGDREAMERVMHRHCKAFSLITLREMAQTQRIDYAYHTKLRRGATYDALLAELSRLSSVQGVNVMMQEATVDL
ncbi:MAG: DUF4956 domain-containing protein [Pseudomonadales bacterium]